MSGRTLETLLRLRRLAVDTAMRDLAVAVRESVTAERHLATLNAAFAEEAGPAGRLAREAPALAPSAAWHARARREVAKAEARAGTAGKQVAAQQQVLGDARAAARSVEAGIDRRSAARRAAALGRAQHELEDIARAGSRRA